MGIKELLGMAATAAAPEAAPIIEAELAAEKIREAEKKRKEEEKKRKMQEDKEKKENERLNSLRDGGRAIGGAGSGSSSFSGNGWLTSIFWASVVIQLLDMVLKAPRPSILIVVLYTVLFIISAIFVFKRDRADEVGLMIAAVLAYGVPYLLKIPALVNIASVNNLALLLSGLIILIPIVPLYLAWKFPEHSKINGWAHFVVAFWLIVFALFAIVTFMPEVNSKSLISNPMAGVKYVWDGIMKLFEKTFTSMNNAIKRAVAQASGQPYEGQEESQVGIYVEDVRPLESGYNTNSHVFVEAKIKAVNVKEKMNVNVICYIEDTKQGTVSPTVLYDVIGNYDNIISCDLGQLKEGNYEVKIRANFEFETTSDIEYTFVGSDIKSDQYDKLNINPITIATYTGGPAELGLPSLTQPLRVDLERLNRGLVTETNTQLSSYPFGVSLKNNWPQGKVMRGLKYVLNTPKEIRLVTCSRKPDIVQEPDSATDRNLYTFSIDTTNAQDVFDAVTCRMNIYDVRALLGNDLKSVKTFAARSRYEYAVEGTTTLVVEKNTNAWGS